MALRQISTHELIDMASKRSALTSPEADDAVRALCDVITELGDEVQLLDSGPARGSAEGVLLHRATLDPADPPRLDIDAGAIADEGMIGLGLFRSR